MKKKIFAVFFMIAALACMLALCVNAAGVCAEGEHVDSWAVALGEGGVTDSAYAVNICSECNLVLKEEVIAPIVESKGYSYYEGSVVQGYYVNKSSLEKFKNYVGAEASYGVVACIEEVAGNNPIDENGSATEKAISVDFTDKDVEHFEIKVTNIPLSSRNEVNIVLCAYMVIDGQVIYIENGVATSNARGVTYNEVKELVDNGVEPEETDDGIVEYRELTLDELSLNKNAFWWSVQDEPYYEYPGVTKEENYFCTRVFTKEELPVGSYVVIGNGWQTRPELWDKDMTTNNARPYQNSLTGTIQITEEMWNKGGEGVFQKIAFNIFSAEKDVSLLNYTEEAIAEIFKIYVPDNIKIAKREAVEKKYDSITGNRLLSAKEIGLVANRYWNSTSSLDVQNGGSKDYYYATKSFTKEELPVGTVIEVETGWQYRPEYWVGENKNSAANRPSNVTVYRFVITEDFWSDGVTKRAFNISQVAKIKLTSDDASEVVSSFKIYVPSESTLY